MSIQRCVECRNYLPCPYTDVDGMSPICVLCHDEQEADEAEELAWQDEQARLERGES